MDHVEYLNLDPAPEREFKGGSCDERVETTSHASINERKVSFSWNKLTNGKLYHRTAEVEQLEAIYRELEKPSATTQFVLISGPSGTGKTSLALSLRSKILVDEGYFLSGKYDQPLFEVQRLGPHSFFCSVLRAYAHQVLKRSDDYIQEVCGRLQAAVGAEGTILTDLIPQLEPLLGSLRNDFCMSESSNANGSLFKYVCRKFLRAASRDDKIVILLDDVEWADEASLDLLESLVTDTKNSVLFVGTSNTGDDEATGRLLGMISRLKEPKVIVTMIGLSNFEEETLIQVISEAFSLDNEGSQSLAQLLFQHSQGNQLFISELLQHVYDTNLLCYDAADNTWSWKGIEEPSQCSTISDLLVQKVLVLPPKTIETIQIASCLGSTIDEEMLNHMMSEPVVSYLNVALDNGLLVARSERHSEWTFAHDAGKLAVYQTIPREERDSLHYRIGRRLWRRLNLEELDRHIFVVVGQLMLGRTQQIPQEEGVAVAKLCLRAAERAIHLSSFQTGYAYLMHGISLLGPRSWRDEYRLSLELHNAAAEMACCTAQFEQVDVHLSAITQNARNFDDTLRAQTTSVNALGSSGRLYEAMDRGRDILKALNVYLPRRASLFQTGVAYLLLRRKLKGKTNERIIRLPAMDDQQKIAAMQMLNIVFLYAALVDPESAPFVAIKMVEMTLAYGLSTVSCVGFSVFAVLVCGYVCSVQLNAQNSTHSSLFIFMVSFGGDIDEGFRLGCLSMELYEKFKAANVWLCRVSVFFYGFVYGWKRPILETVPKLRLAYQRGLESGDIEFAMINASLACWLQMENTPISIVDRELASVFDRLEFHGQKVAKNLMKPYWQALQNFAGYSSGDVTALNGVIITEKEIEDIRSSISIIHEFALFHKLILSYTFGDYIKADECAKGCQSLIDNPFGATGLVMVLFFDALRFNNTSVTLHEIQYGTGPQWRRQGRSIITFFSGFNSISLTTRQS
jgi:predicted ATPase